MRSALYKRITIKDLGKYPLLKGFFLYTVLMHSLLGLRTLIAMHVYGQWFKIGH